MSRHFWLLLVLFKSNSPKAKQSAPGQTLVILILIPLETPITAPCEK
jgi:hypothetical protein